jgi:hypothetical protein
VISNNAGLKTKIRPTRWRPSWLTISWLPRGFISKREQIDYLRKHPRSSRSTKHFDELRVRIYGSAAIANGIVSELPEGGTAPQKTVFTDVFAKRQGVWQAVNAQELPLRTQSQ